MDSMGEQKGNMMTDDEFNKRFGQEPEFSGAKIAVYMVVLLSLVMCALWASFMWPMKEPSWTPSINIEETP